MFTTLQTLMNAERCQKKFWTCKDDFNDATKRISEFQIVSSLVALFTYKVKIFADIVWHSSYTRDFHVAF